MDNENYVKYRFWKFVDINGPVPVHRPELGNCHVWTGSLGGRGNQMYGQFRVNGTLYRAHRVAWEMHNGPIPVIKGWHGMVVEHGCDNPACVRIEHLSLTNQQENLKQRGNRGRGGRYDTSIRLTPAQILEIKELVLKGTPNKMIVPLYGVSHATVSCIRNGHVHSSITGFAKVSPSRPRTTPLLFKNAGGKLGKNGLDKFWNSANSWFRDSRLSKMAA